MPEVMLNTDVDAFGVTGARGVICSANQFARMNESKLTILKLDTNQ